MDYSNYGRWTDFDPTAVHRGEAYGAPRGLLILQLQQDLMRLLREITTAIIGKADAEALKKLPDSTKEIANILKSERSKAWTAFIDRDERSNEAKQQYGYFFASIPYSAAPSLDLDLMIELTEARVAEAHDGLWLLQTDLSYFHHHLKHHEAHWFDSLIPQNGMCRFTSREKLDNIGYSVTIDPFFRARDWQWLLEECRAAKSEMIKPRKEHGEAEAKSRNLNK